MSRWLYLVVGAVAAIAIAGGVVVLASNGDGDSGAGTDTTHQASGVPPDVARVKQTVVAFRRALQGKGGDPCAYMTTQARELAISIDDPDKPCADEVREAVRYEHERQIPPDSPTAAIVQGSQAATVDASAPYVGTPLFLVRRERWLIAAEDEAPAARALEDALKRGEGQ